MLELIQITNDPAFARRCDALDGMRLFVDLERLGKAERQAGRNTFISSHTIDDVGRIKQVLRYSRLMVRVNPLNPGTQEEVDAVLAQGADLLMLPMFSHAAQVREFAARVDGRAPIVLLLESAAALACMQEWIATPGLAEVFVEAVHDDVVALVNPVQEKGGEGAVATDLAGVKEKAAH